MTETMSDPKSKASKPRRYGTGIFSPVWILGFNVDCVGAAMVVCFPIPSYWAAGIGIGIMIGATLTDMLRRWESGEGYARGGDPR